MYGALKLANDTPMILLKFFLSEHYAHSAGPRFLGNGPWCCVLWVVCCGLCVVFTVCQNDVKNPTKSDPKIRPEIRSKIDENLVTRGVLGQSLGRKVAIRTRPRERTHAPW